ncbi:hypothetical protein Plhal304r1_c069g0158341 [Plasmopara halstedii]
MISTFWSVVFSRLDSQVPYLLLEGMKPSTVTALSYDGLSYQRLIFMVAKRYCGNKPVYRT